MWACCRISPLLTRSAAHALPCRQVAYITHHCFSSVSSDSRGLHCRGRPRAHCTRASAVCMTQAVTFTPLHVMRRRQLVACCRGRGGALLRQMGSGQVALVSLRSFPGLAAAQVGRPSMGSAAAGCALCATCEADQETSGEGCCRVLYCFCWAVAR